MHPLRRLYVEWGHFADLVEELENLLVFLTREVVVLQGTSRDHQEKQAPHLRPDIRGDLGDLRQLMKVASRDGRLELRLQADIAGVPESLHGAVERARDAPEAIVRCGIWPVQADRHARYSTPFELLDSLVGQQGSSARGDVGA